MSTKHISNDEFFAALKSLLHAQSASRRGSVFLTQKRNLPSDSSSPGDSSSTKQPILVRLSNGRKKNEKSKASTLVAYEYLEGFYAKYAEICKEGMVAMKKRDRSGKKKAKGKSKK
ncbi:hypothetical protein KEM56_002223 [Ascosphaera pollenicola]|nr:hypothetical protein KEM56_002223 [Ascosphaera pollenicola]